MSLKSEILINKLWKDFQLYIQGNWTLPIEYGMKDGKVKKRILLQDFGEFKPLSQIQPQIKFCQVLCEILKYNLIQKDKAGFKIPHENTMRGFLKSGLLTTTQKNTLNAFAAFLGYEHWDDYRRKNSKDIVKANTKRDFNTNKEEAIQIPAKNESIKYPKVKTNSLFFYSVAIFTCIIITGSIFRLKMNNKILCEKSKVISVIQQANKAEFEAYSKIPMLDTVPLNSFFVTASQEGSARATIIGTLCRCEKAGHTLVKHASSYNLINVSVKKIQDTIAYVTTTEKWHLRWYDTLQKKEVLIYDTTNNHDYILVKRDEIWKVLMDDYQGRLKKPSFLLGNL